MFTKVARDFLFDSYFPGVGGCSRVRLAEGRATYRRGHNLRHLEHNEKLVYLLFDTLGEQPVVAVQSNEVFIIVSRLKLRRAQTSMPLYQ